MQQYLSTELGSLLARAFGEVGEEPPLGTVGPVSGASQALRRPFRRLTAEISFASPC